MSCVVPSKVGTSQRSTVMPTAPTSRSLTPWRVSGSTLDIQGLMFGMNVSL